MDNIRNKKKCCSGMQSEPVRNVNAMKYLLQNISIIDRVTQKDTIMDVWIIYG